MSNILIGGTDAAGDPALPVASTIDGVQDYIPIYTNSATATQAINRNTFLGISSGPVGLTDTQSLTNKTLTSPTISGPTFSGTLVGTYTIGGTPTFPSSVVTLTSTSTLTNKTLTSPTINSPTITNATLSSDTITGYTASTTGTIYGISVTTGTLSSAAYAASSVNTAALASQSVTPTKLNLAPATVNSASTLTVTTTTYGGLSTAVTTSVTVGANGILMIGIGSILYNSGSNNTNLSFALSGANTQAASDAYCLLNPTSSAYGMGRVFVFTGLTAGSTTITLQGKVVGSSTGTFVNPNVWAVPL